MAMVSLRQATRGAWATLVVDGFDGFSHSLTTNRPLRGCPVALKRRAWMRRLVTSGVALAKALSQTAMTRPSGAMAPSTRLATKVSVASLTARDQRTVPLAFSTVTQ